MYSDGEWDNSAPPTQRRRFSTADSAPANSAPADSAPANSAPADSAPANSAPANSATADSAPASMTLIKKNQTFFQRKLCFL
ncbi:Hypothetical protein FKW44_014721 [Caligus rogercresseyi]|uniref:Uncharacterized protein n=1 Tax=Caligus rogercresseyi TaxID=217165 RepID=A0A7T8GZZ5_CALRO|nr:Hypothetical protein FKW44_014721 [Caligus rogercresseyi]